MLRFSAVLSALLLGPVSAFAQSAHDVRAQAGAAVAEQFVRVQQGFDVEFVRQGLAHHRRLIALALLGQRLHLTARRLHPAVSAQRARLARNCRLPAGPWHRDRS